MDASESRINDISAEIMKNSLSSINSEIEQLCGLDRCDHSKYLDQLMKCLESVCTDESRMVLFFELGKVHISQNLDKAIYYIKNSLELAYKLQNNEYRGQTVLILAYIFTLIGRCRQAINYYLIYLEVWDKLSNPTARSTIFRRITEEYTVLKDFENAAEYDVKYSEAYKIENPGKSDAVFEVLYDDTTTVSDENVASRPCHDTVSSSSEELNEFTRLLTSNSIGQANSNSDQIDRALPGTSKSQNDPKKLHPNCKKARTELFIPRNIITRLNIISYIHSTKYSAIEMRYEQNYSGAILHLESLLSTSREIGDSNFEIMAIFYLQDTYRRIAKQSYGIASASDTFIESISKCRWYCKMRMEIAANHRPKSTSIELLMEEYEMEGRYHDGLVVYSENLRKYEKSVNKLYLQNAYMDLGETYSGLNQYNKAVMIYKEAWSVSDKSFQLMILAQFAYNLFRMSYASKNYESASENLQHYLELVKKTNNRYDLLKAYKTLIEFYMEAKNYRLGYYYAKEYYDFGHSNNDSEAMTNANKYSQKLLRLRSDSDKSDNNDDIEILWSSNSISDEIMSRDCNTQSDSNKIKTQITVIDRILNRDHEFGKSRNYENAKHKYSKSLIRAQLLDDWKAQADAHEYLAAIYYATGDRERLIHHCNAYIELFEDRGSLEEKSAAILQLTQLLSLLYPEKINTIGFQKIIDASGICNVAESSEADITEELETDTTTIELSRVDRSDKQSPSISFEDLDLDQQPEILLLSQND